MSEIAELIYFDGRGLAETIRMTLVATNIQFKETPLKTRQDFLSLKPVLLFEQVPLLRIDGFNIVQSRAIMHYLAKKGNIYGSTDAESVKIDQLFEGTKDFYQVFTGIGFTLAVDDVREKTAPSIKKYFTIFSKVLKENGNCGYLVGKSLTLADIGLLEVVLATNDYCGDVLQQYPEILAFFDCMKKEPFYEKYMKEIRKIPNSVEYVNSIKEILAYV